MPVDTAINKNPKVVYRALRDGEGGVLLHLGSGQYHSLNAVGVAMWNLIDGTRSLEDIAAEIKDAYVDAPEDLVRIVREFCDGLRGRDLISLG
jgi:coenzyme PQQ synthesis protein D (PqqD)